MQSFKAPMSIVSSSSVKSMWNSSDFIFGFRACMRACTESPDVAAVRRTLKLLPVNSTAWKKKQNLFAARTSMSDDVLGSDCSLNLALGASLVGGLTLGRVSLVSDHDTVILSRSCFKPLWNLFVSQ